MSSNDEKLLRQIEKLIDDAMENNVAIQGISIGSEIATNIFTKFKPEITQYSENELIASATSFQYISDSLYRNIAKSHLKTAYLMVENHVLIMCIVKEVSSAMVLDRKYAEMEGIEKYQSLLRNLVLQVSAYIETSEYISQDPLVKIIRAVPSALFLAVISKEGLPIKIIDNGSTQGAMVGSQIAAMSNLTQIMMKSPLDYALLQGIDSNIMIIQFDEERILAISIPEHEKANIGQYLARIKEIMKNCEPDAFFM